MSIHRPIYAVIGVRRSGSRTYYVRRSARMENYPLVWSLLSIQYDPDELRRPDDLSKVTAYMERMSAERLGGVPIRTKGLLIFGSEYSEALRRNVTLHLYDVELPKEPLLNPDYYIDGAWMTPEEYAFRSVGQTCGLCLRLWASFGWMEEEFGSKSLAESRA